jgi:hypothetical protein
MNRMEALMHMGAFIRTHQAKFAGLPRDEAGQPTNIEIRKLLAVDAELAIALAALIAVVYVSVEYDARVEASAAMMGRS